MPGPDAKQQAKAKVKEKEKAKPKENTQLVNGMSSGFSAGLVTKGQPMSLAEQTAKKAGGIF
jgi:hypothetical protein